MAEDEVRTCAEIMAKNRRARSSGRWGRPRHTNGKAVVRASCISSSRSNVGVSGGGHQHLPRHDNVQAPTDVGPNADSLPAYYGLTPAAWQHWARVWKSTTTG